MLTASSIVSGIETTVEYVRIVHKKDAIKKFKDLSSNRTVEELINREIQMLKTLKSPYVVEMKEVFRKNNRTYIVFEYMGRNLLKLIE